VGCIPSKALLESSEDYERVLHKFSEHGIKVEGVTFDLPTMIARKDKIVDNFTAGIGTLFRKNRVASLTGRGRFTAAGQTYRIEVRDGDNTQIIEARNVIIATGSTARQLPGAPVDNDRIVDNIGALSFSEVPKRLGVIGAGVIGLEMGSVWKRLGSDVNILEALPSFLPAAYAQQQPPIAGGGGVFIMPAQFSVNTWGCYLLDIDAQTVVAYQFYPGDRQLRFVAARNYRFGRAQSLLIPSINRNRLGMVVGLTRRPS